MDKKILEWVFNRNSDEKAIVRNLTDEIKTRIFLSDKAMLSFVTLPPNTQGSSHKHPEEQWGVLLEGSCVRIQSGQEIQMEIGDFWYTPSNELHGIRSLEEGAVILDIFSPPREAYRKEGKGFGST